MNFQLHLRGLHISSDVRDDIRTIVADSLERLSERVQRISLSLKDINGPRNGVDIEGRCIVSLTGLSPVVITDRDESLKNLIYRIANRASFAVSENIDRHRKKPIRRSSRRRDEVLNEPLLT